MTEWNAFFEALACAAAVVFSVAFAALAFGAGRWRVSALRPAAVALALIQLLVPLFAALIALMPGDVSWQVGYLVMGSVGLLGQILYAARYLRLEDAADGFDQRQLQWGLPVSTCVFLTMLAFSASPQVFSLWVVAGLSIWLLFSGALATWLLLAPGRSEPSAPAQRGSTAVREPEQAAPAPRGSTAVRQPEALRAASDAHSLGH
jgi:hypothetical protein